MNVTAMAKAAKRPQAAASRCLNREEFRLYDSIDPNVGYVYYPSFSLPGAERRLFGPGSEDIPVPQYTLFPQVLDEHVCGQLRRLSLTPQQEKTLFLRYNYAKYRLSKLQGAQRRRFSGKRARSMAHWQKRALELRADLARANLPLVPAMAKRVHISNVEFAELVSEGYMAVLRCVEKFDVSRGFKFSTYACRSILKCFHRLAAKANRYHKFFGVEYDPKMQRGDQVEARHRSQRADSIDAVQEILRNNHAGLSQLERTVILARFAIFSENKPRTLSQVGQMVNLTNEGVRQIQKRALSKILAAFEDQFAA